MAFAWFCNVVIAFAVVAVELVEDDVISWNTVQPWIGKLCPAKTSELNRKKCQHKTRTCGVNQNGPVHFITFLNFILVFLTGSTLSISAAKTQSPNQSMPDVQYYQLKTLNFHPITRDCNRCHNHPLQPSLILQKINQTLTMAASNQTEVVDLATKFRNATLALGNTEEAIIHYSEENQELEEEEQEEISLIGKIFSEGKMSLSAVEKYIGYTWPFISSEELQVIEIDRNVMVFKFKDWDTLNKVIDERPWSIDGNMVIFHVYDPLQMYQELDWDTQWFWIQLKNLMPEHMNIKAVEEMGKIMGEVQAIYPPNAIPEAGVPVKVCVKININNPLRRGVMAITASGMTRWIKYYYEKQPHKICPNCYIINHSKEACKDAAKYVEALHKKPHVFGKIGAQYKNQALQVRKIAQPVSQSNRMNTKHVPFVPPKDGILVDISKLVSSGEEDIGESSRLGKRQRNNGVPTMISSKEAAYQSNGLNSSHDTPATQRAIFKEPHSNNTDGENKVNAMECEGSQQKL